MIINLLTTIAAINLFSAGNATINQNNIDQIKINDICQEEALREEFVNPLEDQYCVKDLNGNIFIIQIGKSKGFMVLDPATKVFIEKSSEMICPYTFTNSHDNYYFGPMQYYEKINNAFYSLVNANQVVSINDAETILQEGFNEQLERIREMYNPDNLDNDDIPLRNNMTYTKMIDNYEYVRDMQHPENRNGTCGFTAASIVLNYWDKTFHSGTVTANYLDEQGELLYLNNDDNDEIQLYTHNNLNDRLRSYHNQNDSDAFAVCNAMNRYCEDEGIHGNAVGSLILFGVQRDIDANKPVILFGSMINPFESYLTINHAVVAYGYETVGITNYYIVDYGLDYSWGHGSSSQIKLIDAWIGSNTTFSLDESYYRSNYVVAPQDYGFPQVYNPSPLTKTVTTNEFSFETNRLRCGYIENSFINLSARKNEFGTSYLEYRFKNAVREMSFDLSFWSANEWFTSPNIAQLYIQCKSIRGQDWMNQIDLLNDVNLPTDRNNQQRVTINFPKKTTNVRIYSHFDYMSGYVDRNKGRLSIGNVEVATYW